MKWGVMALVIAALICTIGACDLFSGDEKTKGDPSDIDWTDYRDFSIRVSNGTKKDLIAFQSTLSTASMLGGIRSGTSDHGLKNDPSKFGENPKQFKMIFITQEQYEANKNTLSQLSNDFFTQMYVYWNGTAGDNEKVYSISGKLGGEYKLVVSNDSNFDVELRVNGPSGPILGFAPHGVVTTTLYVGQGDFDVYPVFKYLNNARGIIETIYPTRDNGSAWRNAFNFEGSAATPQSLNLRTALNGVSKRSSGVCYFKIYNNISTGAIGFMKGTSIQVNALGNKYWNSGENKEFVIEMPTVAGSDSGSFAPTIQISNFKVFQSSDEVEIKDVENKLQTMTLKADMLYSVYVTGEPGSISDPFKALVELREGQTNGPTAVTFSNLF